MAPLPTRRLVPVLTIALLAALSRPASGQHGDWKVERLEGKDSVQLSFSTGPEMNISLPVPLSRLRGLTAAALDGARSETRFEIPSEAGTVNLNGKVGDGDGWGEFEFTPSAAFREALRSRGVRGTSSSIDLFRLAIRSATIAGIDSTLTALRRYDDELPDADGLVRFMNHRVDAAVIADLGDAGLRKLGPNEIIRLVNHDVDGQFVKAAREKGYGDLGAEELIRLRNRGGEFRSGSTRERVRERTRERPAPQRARTGTTYDM